MTASDGRPRSHGLHPALGTVHLAEEEPDLGLSGPDDPPAPLKAACHTTAAALEPTTQPLTCQACAKLASNERGQTRRRRRSIAISFSDAEYQWLESLWPAGGSRAECMRRAIFAALEEVSARPPGRSSSPGDIPVLHWPYIRACARGLRHQDIRVASAVADPSGRPRSAVIHLDPSIAAALRTDAVLSLAWTECDGWALAAERADGREVRMFFGGEVVPEPPAVAQWVKSFVAGRRVAWSDRPPGFRVIASGETDGTAGKQETSLSWALWRYLALTDPW